MKKIILALAVFAAIVIGLYATSFRAHDGTRFYFWQKETAIKYEDSIPCESHLRIRNEDGLSICQPANRDNPDVITSYETVHFGSSGDSETAFDAAVDLYNRFGNRNLEVTCGAFGEKHYSFNTRVVTYIKSSIMQSLCTSGNGTLQITPER